MRSVLSRVVLVAAVAGSLAGVAGAASAAGGPQTCPSGSHGVVIGIPDPNNPYYICVSPN